MKGFKRYLFGGTLIIMLYLVAQYTKPRPTNWNPSYLTTDKNPYGTYILRQQIGQILPGSRVTAANTDIYQTLKNRPEGKSNYLILASKVKITSSDYQEMVRYMKAGNHIFLSAFQLDGVLTSRLKISVSSDFNFNNKRKHPINFVNPNLKRAYDYYFDKGLSEQYFNGLDTSRAIILGLKEDRQANLISYKFGKGTLFILPNPQLLTNYSLLKDDGRDYAAKALSYLPPASTLIWDEHFTRTDLRDESMLRVLFEHEQLRWAYYLALFGLVVFVLYEMKRRQRIIPVIDRLTNTSVEFVKVVGRVYYQRRDHHDIIEKKMTYFLAYIRRKYKLKYAAFDQDLKAQLIRISGASPEIIDQLFTLIITIDAARQRITDKELIRFNELIEQFYEQDQ